MGMKDNVAKLGIQVTMNGINEAVAAFKAGKSKIDKEAKDDIKIKVGSEGLTEVQKQIQDVTNKASEIHNGKLKDVNVTRYMKPVYEALGKGDMDAVLVAAQQMLDIFEKLGRLTSYQLGVMKDFNNREITTVLNKLEKQNDAQSKMKLADLDAHVAADNIEPDKNITKDLHDNNKKFKSYYDKKDKTIFNKYANLENINLGDKNKEDAQNDIKRRLVKLRQNMAAFEFLKNNDFDYNISDVPLLSEKQLFENIKSKKNLNKLSGAIFDNLKYLSENYGIDIKIPNMDEYKISAYKIEQSINLLSEKYKEKFKDQLLDITEELNQYINKIALKHDENIEERNSSYAAFKEGYDRSIQKNQDRKVQRQAARLRKQELEYQRKEQLNNKDGDQDPAPGSNAEDKNNPIPSTPSPNSNPTPAPDTPPNPEKIENDGDLYIQAFKNIEDKFKDVKKYAVDAQEAYDEAVRLFNIEEHSSQTLTKRQYNDMLGYAQRAISLYDLGETDLELPKEIQDYISEYFNDDTDKKTHKFLHDIFDMTEAQTNEYNNLLDKKNTSKNIDDKNKPSPKEEEKKDPTNDNLENISEQINAADAAVDNLQKKVSKLGGSDVDISDEFEKINNTVSDLQDKLNNIGSSSIDKLSDAIDRLNNSLQNVVTKLELLHNFYLSSPEVSEAVKNEKARYDLMNEARKSYVEFYKKVKDTEAYQTPAGATEVEERAALLNHGKLIVSDIVGRNNKGGVDIGPASRQYKYKHDENIHTHPYDPEFNRLRFSIPDIEDAFAPGWEFVKRISVLCGKDIMTMDLSNVDPMHLEDLYETIMDIYNAVFLRYGAEVKKNGNIDATTLSSEMHNRAIDIINTLIAHELEKVNGELQFVGISDIGGTLLALDSSGEHIIPIDYQEGLILDALRKNVRSSQDPEYIKSLSEQYSVHSLSEIDEQKAEAKQALLNIKNKDINSNIEHDNININEEYADINNLKHAIDDVTTAVRYKTEAFLNEQEVVSSATCSEINDLSRLEDQVRNIRDEVDGVSFAFDKKTDILNNIFSEEFKRGPLLEDVIDKESDNITTQFEKFDASNIISKINTIDQAFYNECEIVDSVVDTEVFKLNELENKLHDITAAVNEGSDAFKKEADALGTVLAYEETHKQNDKIQYNETPNKETTNNIHQNKNDYVIDEDGQLSFVKTSPIVTPVESERKYVNNSTDDPYKQLSIYDLLDEQEKEIRKEAKSRIAKITPKIKSSNIADKLNNVVDDTTENIVEEAIDKSKSVISSPHFKSFKYNSNVLDKNKDTPDETQKYIRRKRKDDKNKSDSSKKNTDKDNIDNLHTKPLRLDDDDNYGLTENREYPIDVKDADLLSENFTNDGNTVVSIFRDTNKEILTLIHNYKDIKDEEGQIVASGWDTALTIYKNYEKLEEEAIKSAKRLIKLKENLNAELTKLKSEQDDKKISRLQEEINVELDKNNDIHSIARFFDQSNSSAYSYEQFKRNIAAGVKDDERRYKQNQFLNIDKLSASINNKNEKEIKDEAALYNQIIKAILDRKKQLKSLDSKEDEDGKLASEITDEITNLMSKLDDYDELSQWIDNNQNVLGDKATLELRKNLNALKISDMSENEIKQKASNYENVIKDIIIRIKQLKSLKNNESNESNQISKNINDEIESLEASINDINEIYSWIDDNEEVLGKDKSSKLRKTLNDLRIAKLPEDESEKLIAEIKEDAKKYEFAIKNIIDKKKQLYELENLEADPKLQQQLKKEIAKYEAFVGDSTKRNGWINKNEYFIGSDVAERLRSGLNELSILDTKHDSKIDQNIKKDYIGIATEYRDIAKTILDRKKKLKSLLSKESPDKKIEESFNNEINSLMKSLGSIDDLYDWIDENTSIIGNDIANKFKASLLELQLFDMPDKSKSNTTIATITQKYKENDFNAKFSSRKNEMGKYNDYSDSFDEIKNAKLVFDEYEKSLNILKMHFDENIDFELDSESVVAEFEKMISAGKKFDNLIKEIKNNTIINDFIKQSNFDDIINAGNEIVKDKLSNLEIKPVKDSILSQVEILNQQLKDGEITVRSYKTALDKLTGGLDNISDYAENAEDAISKMTAKLSPKDIVKFSGKLYDKNGNETGAKVVSIDKNGYTTTQIFDNVKKSISSTVALTQQATSGIGGFFNSLKGKWGEVARYFLSFGSLYEAWDVLRQGAVIIRDLDDALTEMNKVSNEPLSKLQEFQKQSFGIAESIGSTGQQIQLSAADFLRLGENFESAKESARSANILFNVAEFESIDDATTSLIAMSSAYKDLDKMQIVDKLNKVGNNYAISTDGIATALQKSASALKTTGTDIDKAIALITAGNAVVQDPDSVGAGIRTIALRMSGTEAAKKELEDIGEDTSDFVVQTTSKIDESLKAFTAVASNDFKGISMLDSNGNNRNPYDVLLDIANIYDEIVKTDKKFGTNHKSGLLELIAGKNRANIAASILQNADILKSVYKTSLNSQGSAIEENQKHLDSISGHIDLLQNKWQELWSGTATRDQANALIDLGTALLDIVDKIGLVKAALAGGGIFLGLKDYFSDGMITNLFG